MTARLTDVLKKMSKADLQGMAHGLGFDPEDYEGVKTLVAIKLYEDARRKDLLDDLIFQIKETEGDAFNPNPYIYLLIVHFATSIQGDRAQQLTDFCQKLGLDVAELKLQYTDLIGIAANLDMHTKKAVVIQEAMNGRERELLLHIREAFHSHRPSGSINLKAFGIEDDERLNPAADKPKDPKNKNEGQEEEETAVTYTNFDVRIRKTHLDGQYAVEARTSNEDVTDPITITIPPENSRFENRLAFLKNLIIRKSDAELLGQTMHNLMLPGEVWSLFNAYRHGLKENERLLLRLRLDAPELESMPWEYCSRIKDKTRYVAHNKQTPIIRFPPEAQPEGSTGIDLPLRLLLVMANPKAKDLDKLDLEAERDIIREKLAPLEQAQLIKVDELSNATVAAAFDKLESDKYDILHFMGHGTLESKEGALVFQKTINPDDGPDLLFADQLQATVANTRLRLILLNSCETNVFEGDQPINGIARALVRSGVPAVIAMQFKVPDTTARIFAEYFYKGLVRGKPLDEIITQMRLAAYVRGRDRVLWGIPVLYMRAKDGVIWKPTPAQLAEITANLENPPEVTPLDMMREMVDEAEAAYTAVKPTLNAAFTPIVDTSLMQLKAELAKDEPDKALLGNFLTALSATMGMFGADAAPIQEKITAAQTAVSDL